MLKTPLWWASFLVFHTVFPLIRHLSAPAARGQRRHIGSYRYKHEVSTRLSHAVLYHSLRKSELESLKRCLNILLVPARTEKHQAAETHAAEEAFQLVDLPTWDSNWSRWGGQRCQALLHQYKHFLSRCIALGMCPHFRKHQFQELLFTHGVQNLPLCLVQLHTLHVRQMTVVTVGTLLTSSRKLQEETWFPAEFRVSDGAFGILWLHEGQCKGAARQIGDIAFDDGLRHLSIWDITRRTALRASRASLWATFFVLLHGDKGWGIVANLRHRGGLTPTVWFSCLQLKPKCQQSQSWQIHRKCFPWQLKKFSNRVQTWQPKSWNLLRHLHFLAGDVRCVMCSVDLHKSQSFRHAGTATEDSASLSWESWSNQQNIHVF